MPREAAVRLMVGKGRAPCPALRATHRLSYLFGLMVVAAIGGPLACSSAPRPNARDVADANDTGRTLNPRSDMERALLGQVATLPTGAPRQLGGVLVRAERPYPAASGRTCRVLTITSDSLRPPSSRLACSDGSRWFFVPNVFGTDSEGSE